MVEAPRLPPSVPHLRCPHSYLAGEGVHLILEGSQTVPHSTLPCPVLEGVLCHPQGIS